MAEMDEMAAKFGNQMMSSVIFELYKKVLSSDRSDYNVEAVKMRQYSLYFYKKKIEKLSNKPS